MVDGRPFRACVRVRVCVRVCTCVYVRVCACARLFVFFKTILHARDVGTSSPAPASIEGGDIKFSATAAATAAASSLGQQQQRWNLPPSIDALPATPIASQPTTFHDSFTERSPGLQRQQQKQQQRGQHQKQRQKLPESAGGVWCVVLSSRPGMFICVHQ